MLMSKKQKEQGTQAVLSKGTTAQLASADLSDFLKSCQTNGINPDDFGMIFYDIVGDVIRANECELKRSLLFLRMIETLLNSLKIG